MPELILLGVVVVFLLPGILIAWQVSRALSRVPEQQRVVGTGAIWALAIPCFSLIWNFAALPRVSRSFRNYFLKSKKERVGDCGEGSAWIYSIVSLGVLLPGKIGVLAWAASIGLVVGHINQLRQLSSQVMKAEAESMSADSHQNQRAG